MANVEFNDAFFSQLGHSPEVTALCVQKAEEVANIARSTAPRDSNDYADSIHVEVVSRQNRNTVLVVASDPKAMLIESKTGNLARAMKQVKNSG